jgi:hypothetical protein
LGDAEAKVQGKVGVAAERLAPAIRVREVEDEVEATGMHIGMVASVFFACSGHHWVMSSQWEAAWVPACQSGVSILSCRVGGGGGTHLCPIHSPDVPAPSTPSSYLTLPILTSLHRLPSTWRDVDRCPSCIDVGRLARVQ